MSDHLSNVNKNGQGAANVTARRSAPHSRQHIAARWDQARGHVAPTSERDARRSERSSTNRCDRNKRRDDRDQDDEKSLSPFDLFAKERVLKDRLKEEVISEEAIAEATEKESLEDDKSLDALSEENKANGMFAAALDSAEVHAAAESVHGSATMTRSSEMQALITKLVDRMQIMQLQGKTETILHLDTAGFEGVKVTISEFATAKGEFNITFEGLSQKAQQLISDSANQDLLKEAMQEKNFTVHIIVASTETEPQQMQTEQASHDADSGEEQQSSQEEDEQESSS